MTQLRVLLRKLQTCNIAEPDVGLRQPPRRSKPSGSRPDAKAKQPATTTTSGTTPSADPTTPAAAGAADASPLLRLQRTLPHLKLKQLRKLRQKLKPKYEQSWRLVLYKMMLKSGGTCNTLLREWRGLHQEVRNNIFTKFLRQYHPDKNQESELAADIGHAVTVFLLNQRDLYLQNQGGYVDEMTPKAKAKSRPKAATPPQQRARMFEDELLGLYEAAIRCANGCGRKRRKW
ncbi:hypothetical protein N9L68_04245 [bacterium]|nr:hypothetical protein [bacterium]